MTTRSSVPPPLAVYVYSWDLYEDRPPVAMYRVIGGLYDGGDVTAETLIEIGIPVPADLPVELLEATS